MFVLAVVFCLFICSFSCLSFWWCRGFFVVIVACLICWFVGVFVYDMRFIQVESVMIFILICLLSFVTLSVLNFKVMPVTFKCAGIVYFLIFIYNFDGKSCLCVRQSSEDRVED